MYWDFTRRMLMLSIKTKTEKIIYSWKMHIPKRRHGNPPKKLPTWEIPSKWINFSIARVKKTWKCPKLNFQLFLEQKWEFPHFYSFWYKKCKFPILEFPFLRQISSPWIYKSVTKNMFNFSWGWVSKFWNSQILTCCACSNIACQCPTNKSSYS